MGGDWCHYTCQQLSSPDLKINERVKHLFDDSEWKIFFGSLDHTANQPPPCPRKLRFSILWCHCVLDGPKRPQNLVRGVWVYLFDSYIAIFKSLLYCVSQNTWPFFLTLKFLFDFFFNLRFCEPNQPSRRYWHPLRKSHYRWPQGFLLLKPLRGSFHLLFILETATRGFYTFFTSIWNMSRPIKNMSRLIWNMPKPI